MSDQIRVLHVDDEPDFADLAATFLEYEDDRIAVHTANDASEGLEYLGTADVDCIVSDHDMPSQTGIEFLRAVRQEYSNLPFILYTGKGSENIASEAISAGVTDYLQKESGTSQYAVLANRITNAVEQSQAREKIEETERKLTQLAEKTDDILFMFNADWSELLFINSAFEDIWGRQVSELESNPGSFVETIHPDDRDDALEAMEQLSNGDSIEIEYRVIQPDGEQRWIRGDTKPIFDENGNVSRIVGFVRDITGEKIHGRELREERAFIEQSLDALQDVFFVFDEDLKMRRWNDQIVAVTGYSDDEVAAMSPAEFFLDDQQTRIADAVREVLETGTASIQADVLTADGNQIPYEFVATRLTGPDGEIVGLAGVGRDITEQQAREAELERAREILEKTERLADVGGWEIDTKTMEVYWTEHLFDLLGVDYEEVPPLDEALDVYHDDDRPLVEDAIESALGSGELFDIKARFVRPDGEIRWLRLQGEPTVEDGAVISLRGAFQDITEQHQRECELEQARQDYEELFNGMNDTGWVIDADQTFIAVNDAAVDMTGYTREELLSMAPHDIDAGFDPGDITALISDMPEDELQVFETIHETKDGRETPVEIISSNIIYQGKPAVLSIARDISERKRREKQLEQFASVVSHDLRNPLNVAQGHLELAQEECASEHLDTVERAQERMNVLIDDLLTLAHEGNEVSGRESVDLSRLVEECWRHVATADASIQIEVDQTIQADCSRLQQLFENLIRNAVEHAGDDVTVTVGDLVDGFYIEDDGSGIPEDHREDVFKVGYTTSDQGTGFGLGITKQVAEAHGWQIRLVEGGDGGSRFEITGADVTPSQP